MSRVGWGFDVHRLDGVPPLVLGGVVVSDDVGVSATSDGDVIAHAVADAILGACALGDLGTYFPSDAPEIEDADSMDLLRRTSSMAGESGWVVSHLDVTVIVENVRLAPHREAIVSGLGDVLGLDATSLSVKATTTDGLGFTGSGEGIAVVAVVTCDPRD